ncbi:YRDC domain-containing protein [Cyclospora cayetanensis]|uniref:YRDC domain-containing protein n=1 Tax=Cyclospora cayetanensis TaxID=88456 RepID=A0A1D3CUL2_9EIME|nr:YRDC domain-containing protein [Cyclospora cayetanensis]
MIYEALTRAAAATAAAAEGGPSFAFPHCCVVVAPAINYAQVHRGALPGGGPQDEPEERRATEEAPAEGAAGLTRGFLETADVEGDGERPQESPGLCLTHYAPCVPSFLLVSASRCFALLDTAGMPTVGERPPLGYSSRLCVLIDGDGALASLSQHFAQYISLHTKGLPCLGGPGQQQDSRACQLAAAAAAREVFAALHAAEEAALQQQQNSEKQVVVLLHAAPLVQWGEEGLAVFDRLFRAASGRTVEPLAYVGGPSPEFLFGAAS